MAMADRIAVMNEGRIEQLDVPGALYDEPATPFVADFIGDMSRLAARWRGDEVGSASAAGRRIGRRLPRRPSGERVHMGLRPESAEVRAVEGADLEATVVTAMVLGDRLQVVARLDDGQELLLRQREGRRTARSRRRARATVWGSRSGHGAAC